MQSQKDTVIVGGHCSAYSEVRVSLEIPAPLAESIQEEIVRAQYPFAESWFGNVMRKIFYVLRIFSSPDLTERLVILREIFMYAHSFKGTSLGLRSLENNLLELYFYWKDNKTAIAFYSGLQEHLAKRCFEVSTPTQVQATIGAQFYTPLDTELHKQMVTETAAVSPVDIVADIQELENHIAQKAGWFMTSRQFPLILNLLKLASTIAKTEKGVLILEKLYLELHVFWSDSIEAPDRFTSSIQGYLPHAFAAS